MSAAYTGAGAEMRVVVWKVLLGQMENRCGWGVGGPLTRQEVKVRQVGTWDTGLCSGRGCD